MRLSTRQAVRVATRQRSIPPQTVQATTPPPVRQSLWSLDAPPTISAYAVSNPSGQNVTVRFNATEQLSTISVSISNAESATLSSTDFTETAITGGNYTYDASYTGISDGTYTATLDTAADAAGNDGATGQQDSVIVDTTPPTAAAGENQTVDEDTTVQFNGSNTTDNTGIASYNWSFGDGMNATGQTVTHTYTDSGEYTVTLTVEDAAEGVIESVTHEDAGCWNCVYERQHPARGDFYRRVLQCNGDRDARVVRAS